MSDQPNWPPDTDGGPPDTAPDDAQTPARPMPDEAVYSGWLGKAARDLAPTTEADPVAILATLMAAFAAMVGSRPRVQIHDDRHPAVFWPMIMGRTSIGRKGMSYGVVRPVIRCADEEFYRESITSGLSSGEGLITAVADDEEDGVRPLGGKQRLIVETEYGVTMARAGKEGNSLGGILRQAWDGDHLRTMTRSSLRATSPHIVIIGHITPTEFRARVKSAEMGGGTYNRFFPIYSERLHELPEGEGAPEELVMSIAVELAKRTSEAEHVGKVGLKPDAREYWNKIVYSALSASPEADGAVAQFTARATAYARRVAMLYALSDMRTIVSKDDLHAAYALVNYSRATAAYVLGDGTGDPHLDKLILAVNDAGETGLTRSEVSDAFGRHLSKDQLDDLIKKLEAIPGVTREQRKTKGRPAEVWTLGAKEAKEAKEGASPADSSFARRAKEPRNKGAAPDAQDLIRSSFAEPANDEPAGQDPYPASFASFAAQEPPECLREDEGPDDKDGGSTGKFEV